MGLFKYCSTIFLSIFMLIFIPFSARAFECPPGITDPRECILMGQNIPGAFDPSKTVELEHNDRKNRLARLSIGGAKPEFHTEYLLPSEHKLPNYSVPIPVLRVVFDNDVFFDTGKAEIRPEAFSVLQTISKNLNKEPSDVALFVVGHTDKVGNSDYNYNLGLRRANAVAEALARRGIYQANIYRLSFGEDAPRDKGNSKLANMRNRRVEFLFSANVEAATLWVKKTAVIPCVAKDKSDVKTCKREVKIEVKKVEVSPERQKEIVALNKAEAAIVNNVNLSEEQINTQRQMIELRRNRIPIKIETHRIQVSILRGGVAHSTPIITPAKTNL
ncbi:MAG TPA: OmpA family protein [Hellea balneolensis]|uniref:OmpA family protein n=1 Tax=Hellea balneolensis TaxID=287478 RepID=A0A7C5LX50_9PROT|nr:OmpA family protein [Hellea balneolensis]